MSVQPEWLIRSGSRLLGPYTQAEILLKLREKELSLHDEVSEPLGRWWPIQYHPRMEDIVEDFRSQTATDRTDALGATPTASLTDVLGEATPKFKMESKVVETFGVYKQSPQNQNLKGLQSLMWIFSIVVIAGGVGFFWYQQKNKVQKIEQAEQLNDLKNAERALFVGDYRQALDSYKKVAAKNPQSNEYSIYLAPLYLQVDKQTLLAKRELEKIAQANQSAEAQTAMGLMYFMDGNSTKASEHFKLALQINPNYHPALLNTGYLYMAEESWNHARQWFESRYERNKVPADWNIAYAVASIEAYEKSRNQRFLQEAELFLSDAHLKIQDRMQDVLMVRSRIAALMNDDERFKKNVAGFLNQEIDGFRKVRHNAFAANAWFEDDLMIPLCKKTMAALTAQPEKGLFEVYCAVRAGQMDAAQKKMTQLREQMPKHALVQAWASFILDQLHQQEEASVLLGRALEMNRSAHYSQPNILQAQFCFARKDYSCAEQNWQGVLQSQPDSLPAQVALAHIKFLTGRNSEASEDLRRVQPNTEDYKPFLELQWKERNGVL